MSLQLFVLLLALSFASCRAAEDTFGLSTEAPDLRDDLETVYHRLFESETHLLSLSESLDHLNRLKTIYSNDPNKFKSDYERIMRLINLSDVTEAKCRLHHLVAIRDITKENLSGNVNIYNYIKHYSQTQLSLCKDLLASLLRQSVEELTDDERQRVELLRESIMKASSKPKNESMFLHLPWKTFTDGIFPYLEQSLNSDAKARLLKGKKGKEFFNQEFEKSIKNLCKDVERKLKPTVELYDLFVHNLKDMREIDQLTVHWLENADICRIISIDSEGFSKDVYAEFKHKNSQSGSLHKLLGCFKSEQH